MKNFAFFSNLFSIFFIFKLLFMDTLGSVLIKIFKSGYKIESEMFM